MSAPTSDEALARRFRRFAELEAEASPLYAALALRLADDAELRAVFASLGDRHVTLFFAAVQRVLADHREDPLAAYYASFDGERAPDAQLAKAFESFVTAHRDAIEALTAGRVAQTNEPRRVADLRPAFGWAQACFGRRLGLIEVGTSAGLLLHVDRYAYEYEFADGTVLERGAQVDDFDDAAPIVLRCPVRGAATAKTLAPFVTKDLRISSRVGLDLNPLNPADAETRAWLRAMVWPEQTERRVRLDAALAMAVRHPVRLRKGNALDILGAAVEMVTSPAVPCVFVSNVLAHFPPGSRAAFVDLIRDLGSRRDLVLLMKEAPEVCLDLFTDARADDPHAPHSEPLGAVVYQAGRERCVSLGFAGSHGSWLDWAPTML
jgi:hypothetical protein